MIQAENADLRNIYCRALAHYHEVKNFMSQTLKENNCPGATSGKLLNLLKINDLMIKICQKEMKEDRL